VERRAVALRSDPEPPSGKELGLTFAAIRGETAMSVWLNGAVTEESSLIGIWG